MEIQFAASKVDKFNLAGSGDTIEVVERPNGGLSIAMASGYQNGKSSKMVSFSVVKKIIAFIADGVRDGAAARAASDALFTQYNGKSQAALIVFSADFQTQTLVFSCNSTAPVFLHREGQVEKLTTESTLIGTGLDVRPSITEIPIEPGMTIIAPSMGMMNAGSVNGHKIDFVSSINSIMETEHPSPKVIADSLIGLGIRMDNNEPHEDMSVLVFSVQSRGKDNIRRISVSLPVVESEE